MKQLLVLCAALLTSCLPGIAQLVLNTGETWTYQFDTLPQTGFVPAFGINPNGQLQFTIDGASFQTGDRLLYEMFENNTSETPVASGTLSSAPPDTFSCQRDYAWQDRQGAIRFTMQAGSLTVDSITLQAIVAGPSLSQYEVYSTTLVPEPTTVSLFASGSALLLGFILMKRWNGRNKQRKAF